MYYIVLIYINNTMNKYTRWYNQITERAPSRITEDYTETHHIQPRSLGGTDDEYNLVRARFGDTTDSMAQVKALRHLGLNPRFVQNLTLAQLKAEIASGRPLATGWLHQGSYRSPSGGGHWSVVVGTQDKATVHHDPFGASDIVNGGYKSATGGKFVVYADQYWLPRWEVKGGDGWAMLIAP